MISSEHSDSSTSLSEGYDNMSRHATTPLSAIRKKFWDLVGISWEHLQHKQTSSASWHAALIQPHALGHTKWQTLLVHSQASNCTILSSRRPHWLRHDFLWPMGTSGLEPGQLYRLILTTARGHYCSFPWFIPRLSTVCSFPSGVPFQHFCHRRYRWH